MYTLVIELPFGYENGELFEQYLDLEDRIQLIESGAYEVDGNEWGCSSFDIFITTNDVHASAEIIRPLLSPYDWRMKYRTEDDEGDGGEFTFLA